MFSNSSIDVRISAVWLDLAKYLRDKEACVSNTSLVAHSTDGMETGALLEKYVTLKKVEAQLLLHVSPTSKSS